VWYHLEGETVSADKPALSCRLNVTEGMVVTKMNPLIVVKGINK
jgi:NADH dehydrogenase/NADH:ubiquinone oxidoreductase subunit G